MSSLDIKKCTITEIESAPNFLEILREYAEELAVEGLPHPSAKMEMYHQLEKIGILHPIAAYLGDKIIGFVNILMTVNPHYGVAIASTESFFVSKIHRDTGAGLKLRSEAEVIAKELGSAGFIISGPTGGPLVALLEKSKVYKELSRSFYRSFSNV